jgi:type II secretory pathway pseudopilin PulG
LIEIIVAVGVLAVGLYAIATGLQSARVGTAVALRAMKAEAIANNVVELLQCAKADVASALNQGGKGRIPAKGFRQWAGDAQFSWAAELQRQADQSAIVAEVTVVRTKDPASAPVGRAVGVIVLRGGAQ